MKQIRIFATGLKLTDYSRRAGYQIHGVDGMTVSKKWENSCYILWDA